MLVCIYIKLFSLFSFNLYLYKVSDIYIKNISNQELI